MRISVGGPQSELEAEAKKKLITEKEIKEVLSNDSSPKDLRRVKTKLRELLDFYGRIIKSVDATTRSVKGNSQLTYREKKDRYLIQQVKELSQAKGEKAKFRRYLRKIKTKLRES